MKKFLFFLFLSALFQLHAEQTKILWIGNSYTSVNNLPLLFHDLALSAGDSVVYDSNSPGGYTLLQQSQNATTIQKIFSQQWDYVVIQAQSQEPSFPPLQVETETFPYARVLDSLIHANDSCTETVFYMTWGKKYGDQGNCGGYPILCTFDGVQQRLRESYLQMADDNHAIVAPVGMAWSASWHTDTLINLWNADNSHPNIAGSYLTACVFYGTIFRKSPVGIVYSPISAQATNDHLQNIAYHTVFDSLSNWNIGEFDPKAGFDFTGNEATKVFTFNNFSQNFSSFEWHFGDENSSTTSGVHTYSDTGTFTTTLIVFDGCGKSDTSSQTFSIHDIVSGLNELSAENFSVFPNPATDELNIQFQNFVPANSTIEIADVDGRVLLQSKIQNQKFKVGITGLESGVYLLKINGAVKKLMKL